MIASLSGTVRKLSPPHIAVDVHGVGYLVTVPLPVFDELKDGQPGMVITYTYVREDRLELFGFLSTADRSLFSELLNLSGIGPKTALELCSIPRSMLVLAAQNDDASTLTKVKGIGRKTAEKLIVDLKQLLEKHPEWSTLPGTPASQSPAAYDDDAIAALAGLGYDRPTIVEALTKIPKSLKKTEERVAAALRSL